MSAPVPPAAPPPAVTPPEPEVSYPPHTSRREVREAIAWLVALLVVGALLGFAWSAWAHGSSRAGSILYSTSIGNIPDETEGFVAGDGRFLVLTGAVGLLAGVVAWLRRGTRGPAVAAALALGGTGGALLTGLVGHLVSAGRTSAPLNQAFTPKLVVHATGLYAVEGGLALLVYVVMSLVIGSDALGREDEDRAAATAAAGGMPSADAGHDLQHRGWDGYGPGRPDQRDLPPQQGDLPA